MAAHDGFTELRIKIPHQLAIHLDGIKKSKGHTGLDVFCVPVLEAAAADELHRATVLLRCAGINPLAREPRKESME